MSSLELDFDPYFYPALFFFFIYILLGFIKSNSLTSVSAFRSFFKISKKNRNIVIATLYIYVTLVFCPYLDDKFNYLLDNDQFFFIYVTLSGLTFNILNSQRNNDYKFVNYSFFKCFSYSNLIIFFKSALASLNKFSLFFYRNILLVTVKMFRKLYTRLLAPFTFWTPLFKKSSYFAFYKSFISKFK
jgi:hypothetical protein